MAFAWGAEYIYEPVWQSSRQSSCELPGGKFVIIYEAIGAGGGWAVVGSVVGNVITFGPPSQYTAGGFGGNMHGVCPLDTDKFAVAYGDNGLGQDCYTRVGIVTGLNIAWGAAVEFQNNNAWYLHCCQINTDKYGIVYTDSDNWDANVCICSVVGDVITAGAPVIFDGGGAGTTSCISWSTDKFIIAYTKRVGASGGMRIVTVAGLVPTCHAEVLFENVLMSPAQFEDGLAKVDTNLFAISWRRGGGGADPNNAQCIRMGSVSGNVITLGPYYVLNPFNEYPNGICVEALTTNPAQFAVLAENDGAPPPLAHGVYNILDFVGTTITNFGAKQVFIAHTISQPTCANLGDGRLAVSYRPPVPFHGTSVIGVFLNPPAVTTNPATGVT